MRTERTGRGAHGKEEPSCLQLRLGRGGVGGRAHIPPTSCFCVRPLRPRAHHTSGEVTFLFAEKRTEGRNVVGNGETRGTNAPRAVPSEAQHGISTGMSEFQRFPKQHFWWITV